MQITMGGKTYDIRYVEDANIIAPAIAAAKPEWITYDTESTGLHLKKDKPFWAAIAWTGMVYVFPATRHNLKLLQVWALYTKRLYAHNTTFDMHMTANMTGDSLVFGITNWGDTMGLCRLIFEAISKNDGGDSLKLKDIAVKYIDKDANRYEKEVKAWIAARTRANNSILTATLRGAGFTRKAFDQLVKDDAPFPPDMQASYDSWLESCPAPTYQDVPIDIMLPYLATDVILTDLLVHKALPVVYHRKQDHIMEKEFKLLRTVFRMERRGIETDREYLLQSRDRMKAHIKETYEELWALTGVKFSVNQHKLVADLFEKWTGERPKSADKQYLAQQARLGDRRAKLITKLRRMEKWLSTYIDRILEVSEYDGRFYTSCGQFNPVSGRFSGDAQQFPKDPIYTPEGERIAAEHQAVPESEVIFNARRAFKMRGYYLDYSQVELRVQGHYTLHFGGDLNLCRAYMPFKCVHYKTGEEYRFDTFEKRWRWNGLKEGHPKDMHWEDQLKEGWSVWVVPETGETWIPTDVHGSTSLRALAAMGIDPKTLTKAELKTWRQIGKRFNFMRKKLAHVKPFELLGSLTA